MRKEPIGKVVLLGMVLAVCLMRAATGAGAGITFNKQGGGAKNPFVAALEKKIAGRENEPAEKVFKNLQLFKAMPAGRLLRVMEVAFSASLGVDCAHCHTPEQWEKDDKETKQTARKMWTFTSKLNQDLKEAIGKGQVNCTTCHRGQTKPALALPVVSQ